MTLVHCPTCHREERWEAETRHVLVEGGARRPREAPALASWRILRRARDGRTGPVVGACDACGLPMVSRDLDAPALDRWVLDAPEGQLVVAGGITGPSGAMSDDEAEAWLTRQLRNRIRIRPGLWAFQGVWMAFLVVPVLLWLAAIWSVIVFITGYFGGQVGT